MIRLAVLGAGSHSSISHGAPLQRCQQERPDAVELCAVCDLDEPKAKAYAERFGFARTYADLERMVGQESPDGIVAVTPLPLTEDLALRVARLGVPLVVEKPPGEDIDAARRLAAAMVATGVPHMVSFNRRFSPSFARARAWLDGRPRPQLAISRMLRHERREDEFVYGTGIHSVDNVLAVMGRPTRVVSHAYPVSSRATPFFDARAEFAGGGAAQIVHAPACGRREESLELIGDGYDVRIDQHYCGVTIYEADEPVLAWQAPDDMPEYERIGGLDEMRAFIRCLETGEGWWPTLAETLWSAETAAAIQRGGTVELAGR